jgi:hypothetical protein
MNWKEGRRKERTTVKNWKPCPCTYLSSLSNTCQPLLCCYPSSSNTSFQASASRQRKLMSLALELGYCRNSSDRLQTGDCRKPSGSCYVHRPLQDWRQRGVLFFIAVYQEDLDYSSSSFLNSGACDSNISGNGKQIRDTSLRAVIEAVYSVMARR